MGAAAEEGRTLPITCDIMSGNLPRWAQEPEIEELTCAKV